MIRTFVVLSAVVGIVTPALAQGGSAQRSTTGMSAAGTTTGGGMISGPYGWHERPFRREVYFERYRLTPRDYRRLRAMGFTRDEAFMIGNATRATGLPHRTFEDAIYRGLYARQISIEYGILPNDLTNVWKEWNTPEWAAATGESVYTKDKLDVWY